MGSLRLKFIGIVQAMIDIPALVILAAGGHAAEVFSYLCDLANAQVRVELLGVIDEGKPCGDWEGTQILGGFDALAALLARRSEPISYITAVGNNTVRRKLVHKAQSLGPGLQPWTLQHPTAQVGRSVGIGEGTLLAPGVIVTTRVQIGSHCILNAKASVHHDCVVGNFVNVNPGATVAGSVRIADDVFVGAGATIINGLSIGEGTVVGAGAVVTKDLPAHVTAMGVPARVTKQHFAQS